VRRATPGTRIVVLLAGTDIYPSFAPDAATLAALERADALVALQPRGREVLPPSLRAKTRTIVQSATAQCPARARRAVPRLRARPPAPGEGPADRRSLRWQRCRTSAIELTLAGARAAPELAAAARAAAATDPRAHWLGELPAARGAPTARPATSASCHRRPKAAPTSSPRRSQPARRCSRARVPGNLGLLGDDWPGHIFRRRRRTGSAALLRRAATGFHILPAAGRAHARATAWWRRARERAAWASAARGLGCRRVRLPAAPERGSENVPPGPRTSR
jgi:hypothetical protein